MPNRVSSVGRVMDVSSLVAGAKVTAAAIVAWWLGLPGALQLLVFMQMLDIASGVLAAGNRKELSSTLARRGIRKKVFVWILVLAVNVLQTQLRFTEIIAGFTPAEVTAVYFAVVVEGTSILENAHRAGVPIPKFMIKWMELASSQFGDVEVVEIRSRVRANRVRDVTVVEVDADIEDNEFQGDQK